MPRMRPNSKTGIICIHTGLSAVLRKQRTNRKEIGNAASVAWNPYIGIRSVGIRVSMPTTKQLMNVKIYHNSFFIVCTPVLYFVIQA